MLKRVSDLPQRKSRSAEPYVAKDVREFCRNQTYDYAEVIAEKRKPNAVAAVLRLYIKRHPDTCKGVKVAQRNGHVYLCREVQR